VTDARRGGLRSIIGGPINSAFFLVVGICFFLPFFTVECSAAIPEALEGLAEGLGEGQEFDFGDQDLSESVTGWQLVIGDAGETGAAAPGQSSVEDPGPDPVAVAALAVAALGLLLSWIRRPIGPILAILLGVAGTILLVLVWTRISDRIPQEAQAFVELKTEPAFWIAVVVSALGAVWGAVRLFTERETPGPVTASSTGPPRSGVPPATEPPPP
jgi:MYXO-CTERM domain-containing protein